MKFLIVIGLLVSASSFAATKTTCPSHYSDSTCKKQCSGPGRSYEAEGRVCSKSNGLIDSPKRRSDNLKQYTKQLDH